MLVMGKIESFEDLDVFQRAYKVSLEVHKVVGKQLPADEFELRKQIRNASKSVCANIAEGFGKKNASVNEFKRFLSMSIGSSDEMRVWIRYCLDLGYINEETWDKWRSEYVQISRMIHGLKKKF